MTTELVAIGITWERALAARSILSKKRSTVRGKIVAGIETKSLKFVCKTNFQEFFLKKVMFERKIAEKKRKSVTINQASCRSSMNGKHQPLFIKIQWVLVEIEKDITEAVFILCVYNSVKGKRQVKTCNWSKRYERENIRLCTQNGKDRIWMLHRD